MKLSKPTFFYNLDALRFLAFWGIFCMHVFRYNTNNISPLGIKDFILTFITFPYFGVPFFFNLSAFLITYKILEEYSLTGNFILKKFYWRRALRIWPLYFLFLFICFLVLPLIAKLFYIHTPTLPALLPFLLFYSNFYIIEHGLQFLFALAIFWSLAIEEQFYLFWGIFLKFLHHYFIAIIIGLLVLSIWYSSFYLYIWKLPLNNLRVHTLFALPNFCLGAIIAHAAVKQNKLYKVMVFIPKIYYSLVYIFLIVMHGTFTGWIIKADPITTNLINAIIFSLIIFDQAIRKNSLFKAGKSKLINYWGKISYGLYVYHALMGSYIIKLFSNQDQSLFKALSITGIIFLATLFVAHLSYKLYESFFLRKKENI